MSQAHRTLPSFDPGMLHRMDVPGPRYTSYPTADRFHDGFALSTWSAALATRKDKRDPLSVYVHLPFCASVCYYCGCNKVVTRQHSRALPYLQALKQELHLATQAMHSRQAVDVLHLGGGTPTFLSDEELADLLASLQTAFEFQSDAELAIEIDPRTVDLPRLARLRAMGFNRISLGVQDVQLEVQQAVHRVQSTEHVAALLAEARRLGFTSSNVDLIYGLPLQTPDSVAKTVAEVTAWRPDRVALYGYAHLPQRFAPQRRIVTEQLPSGESRMLMLHRALHGFSDAGYVHIGMDHFALPDDGLAKALAQGTLHRNFQGYSAHSQGDLLALGVSAISQVAGHFAQNAKTIEAYEESLTRDELPVHRGYAMTVEDLLRRDIVMAIMCQGEISIGDIESRHGIDFARHFASSLPAVEQLERDGMLHPQFNGWKVSSLGRFFLRAVAMVFDEHLQAASAAASLAAGPGGRFSRIL